MFFSFLSKNDFLIKYSIPSRNCFFLTFFFHFFENCYPIEFSLNYHNFHFNYFQKKKIPKNFEKITYFVTKIFPKIAIFCLKITYFVTKIFQKVEKNSQNTS